MDRTTFDSSLRKPYSAPEVVVHGDIATLTEQAGPGAGDNAGGQGNKT